MAILIDTHTIVWFGTGDPRLSETARTAIQSDVDILISSVTAYEFADLNRRGRFGADLSLGRIIAALSATVIDYPAESWRLVQTLPAVHNDPVDRMMIAHALHIDVPIVTADRDVRKYPVQILW